MPLLDGARGTAAPRRELVPPGAGRAAASPRLPGTSSPAGQEPPEEAPAAAGHRRSLTCGRVRRGRAPPGRNQPFPMERAVEAGLGYGRGAGNQPPRSGFCLPQPKAGIHGSWQDAFAICLLWLLSLGLLSSSSFHPGGAEVGQPQTCWGGWGPPATEPGFGASLGAPAWVRPPPLSSRAGLRLRGRARVQPGSAKPFGFLLPPPRRRAGTAKAWAENRRRGWGRSRRPSRSCCQHLDSAAWAGGGCTVPETHPGAAACPSEVFLGEAFGALFNTRIS